MNIKGENNHIIIRNNQNFREVSADENIEGFEGIDKAEEICKEVSDYVWKVEILRCNNDVSRLYIHIAHTPTAQNFIQEIESLWQREKNNFTTENN